MIIDIDMIISMIILMILSMIVLFIIDLNDAFSNHLGDYHLEKKAIKGIDDIRGMRIPLLRQELFDYKLSLLLSLHLHPLCKQVIYSRQVDVKSQLVTATLLEQRKKKK